MNRSVMLAISAIAFLSLPSSLNAGSQEGVETPIPKDGGRFAVLNSPVSRLTIKLDRYNGDTWLLLSNSDWREIPREAHPDDTAVTGQVSYQVLMSGVSVQATLLNINTGVSWSYRVTGSRNGDVKWVLSS